MGDIKKIPRQINELDADETDPFWQQEDLCAGFIVSDDCPWRFEEMSLVTFTPDVCTNNELIGCEYLVAYARILQIANTQEEASLQFSTTLFTCVVLTVAFMVFSRDTEIIVIIPIKKVVEII